jgi:hypothetical protein
MTYTVRTQSAFIRAMRRVGMQSYAIAAMIWHELAAGEQAIVIGGDILAIHKGA